MKPLGGPVVVIGGGVIGCASAYFLAKAGLAVTLIERDQIGAQASAAAAGMLAPLAESRGPTPFLALALASLRLFETLERELKQETGIDIELSRCGILRVAEDPQEVARLQRFHRWQKEAGLPTEWLDAAAARDLEPGLGAAVLGAIYSPTEMHVQSPRLTQALALAAQARGARFCTGTPVTGFRREGNRVCAAQTAAAEIDGATFVLAAGAWGATCTRWLGIELPVFPVRGQILALSQTTPPLKRIVYGGHAYLVPKQDGSLVVGATEEHAGFDARVTAAGLAGLLDRAAALYPPAAEATFLRAWSGLRPGSQDGHPLLGPLPGWTNVLFAGGHFRNGVLLSAVTGQSIAELVTEGRSTVPLERFDPARFVGGSASAPSTLVPLEGSL